MPPATVTTWPETCPEMRSEARATTCAATSSGFPSFFRDIVEVTRSTVASSRPFSPIIGVTVQPGATAFTLTPGPIRAASFLAESSRPVMIPPLAAGWRRNGEGTNARSGTPP